MKFMRILEVFSEKALYKSYGPIFSIFAFKNEAVCCWVQTHFGSSLPARFTQEVLGAFLRFMCPKMKLFPAKFGRISEVFTLRGIQRKFWAHYHDLCVQKRNSLAWCSDAFGNFSACKVYAKSSGWNLTIYASKNEAVCCEVDTHFGSFLRASFIKTFLSAFSHFLCPQTKLFAVKFRRILEVLCLQGLQRKLCTNFHDLCTPKRRFLLWSSHTFWKFSACKVYRKSYGHIITIYASKNETVCCEVQTHCGSSPPARFTEKSLVA